MDLRLSARFDGALNTARLRYTATGQRRSHKTRSPGARSTTVFRIQRNSGKGRFRLVTVPEQDENTDRSSLLRSVMAEKSRSRPVVKRLPEKSIGRTRGGGLVLRNTHRVDSTFASVPSHGQNDTHTGT